ncbi:MAG TPA: dihydroorotate dehydrogenase [Aliiroseovarius sp.]|nr:dihydroorotate dehydrogenase [Aliiroseovarius sp.]
MNERNIRELDDSELDLLFEAARDTSPLPSPDLLARVLAGAEALQPGPPEPAAPAAAPGGRGASAGLFAGLLAAVGGWAAVAGLATATLAGVWIGYAHPDLAAGWAVAPSTEVVYDLSDFEPRYDDFTPLMEGS